MRKNKRTFAALILIAIVMMITASLLAGCSAEFQRQMKDVQSNYGGGLNRTVTAYSATGEEIGKWQGKIDVKENENKVLFDLNGKRTIIYNAPVIVQEE